MSYREGLGPCYHDKLQAAYRKASETLNNTLEVTVFANEWRYVGPRPPKLYRNVRDIGSVFSLVSNEALFPNSIETVPPLNTEIFVNNFDDKAVCLKDDIIKLLLLGSEKNTFISGKRSPDLPRKYVYQLGIILNKISINLIQLSGDEGDASLKDFEEIDAQIDKLFDLIKNYSQECE